MYKTNQEWCLKYRRVLILLNLRAIFLYLYFFYRLKIYSVQNKNKLRVKVGGKNFGHQCPEKINPHQGKALGNWNIPDLGESSKFIQGPALGSRKSFPYLVNSWHYCPMYLFLLLCLVLTLCSFTHTHTYLTQTKHFMNLVTFLRFRMGYLQERNSIAQPLSNPLIPTMQPRSPGASLQGLC